MIKEELPREKKKKNNIQNESERVYVENGMRQVERSGPSVAKSLLELLVSVM